MIPSLVAGELRASVVEYLATTFALSDDETYEALTRFLMDSEDGIFRGPYLRVRKVGGIPDPDRRSLHRPGGGRPGRHQGLAAVPDERPGHRPGAADRGD